MAKKINLFNQSDELVLHFYYAVADVTNHYTTIHKSNGTMVTFPLELDFIKFINRKITISYRSGHTLVIIP